MDDSINKNIKNDNLDRKSNDIIELSEKDLQVFFDAIDNPKPPSENLKRAYNEYKKYFKN